MRYYKVIEDGYIVTIGTGYSGKEITDQEYNELLSIIRNKPKDTPTLIYKLNTDLTWEAVEVEPEPDDDDLTPEEILAILLGEGDEE